MTAVIEGWRAPISEAARSKSDPLGAALNDGEDFELLFCVSGGDADRLEMNWVKHSPVRLSRIGRIVARERERVLLRRCEEGPLEAVKPGGWEHFREE